MVEFDKASAACSSRAGSEPPPPSAATKHLTEHRSAVDGGSQRCIAPLPSGTIEQSSTKPNKPVKVTGYLQSAPRDLGEGFAHRLRWAHAVNSRRRIVQALNSDVHLLEADVSFGPLLKSGQGTDSPDEVETQVRVESGEPIIMAHYPTERSSDLSLEHFVKIVLDFNNSVHADTMPYKLSGDASPSQQRKRRPAFHKVRSAANAAAWPPQSSIEISTEDEAEAFTAELETELDA